MDDDSAPATDRHLIARIIGGDDNAAHEFYDEHFDYVWSIISRYCERADDASDLAQETFIRIFDTLPGFRGESSIRTWIFRICYSCALDHVRRLRANRNRPAAWISSDNTARTADTDPYLRARIADAVEALSAELREVFLMYDVHGMSHDEIAVALGIPSGTSKSRLSTARARLREALGTVWKERNT